MKLRRDILLFATLALVALAGGAFLLLNGPAARIDHFLQHAKVRATAARQNPANAEAFRATVCADSSCVLVEAGGLSFLIGAGEGAAEGLASQGLMRANLDAVVLPDMTLESIAGLPGVARASLAAGRREPLKIYGPSGVVPVIDGANLLLSGEPGVRLAVGADKEDQGLEGLVVFDSGVVKIRAFDGSGSSGSRVYRVDFENKSLVIAGCRALGAQIVSASRGTRSAAGVLAASSPKLEGREGCIPLSDTLEAARQAKLQAVLLSSLRPSAAIPDALEAWRAVIAGEKADGVVAGEPGSVIDLSAERPSISTAGQTNR